jgi:hypothetical protein
LQRNRGRTKGREERIDIKKEQKGGTKIFFILPYAIMA